jgi:ParB-like chromosome segregation protein Spo0J
MSEPEATVVDVGLPVEDFSVYPRSSVSHSHVRHLAYLIENGVQLPPVYLERGTYRINDGIHRVRAYRMAKQSKIPAVLEDYTSNAEFFRLAVARNAKHGRPFGSYDLRHVVVLGHEIGLTVQELADTLQLAPVRVEEMHRVVFVNGTDRPEAVKEQLEYLEARVLDSDQARVHRAWSGMGPVKLVRRLLSLIQADMFDRYDLRFIEAMDALVSAWTTARSGKEPPHAKASGS